MKSSLLNESFLFYQMQDGTTLRCVLAAALSCRPMRITKKFAGIGEFFVASKLDVLKFLRASARHYLNCCNEFRKPSPHLRTLI